MDKLKNVLKLVGSKRSLITLGAGGISLYTLVKNIAVPSVVITALICVTILGLGYLFVETKRPS